MASEIAPDVYAMRHSCAHLMAAAIRELYPEAKFGVGPPTATGFYYDIDLPEPLKLDDLQKIEQMMRKLRKKKLRFDRRELPIEDAIGFMREHHQDYKVELLQLLRDRGTTAIADVETLGYWAVRWARVGVGQSSCGPDYRPSPKHFHFATLQCHWELV